MEYILEDLYTSVLSETDISDIYLLSEEGNLKSSIKDIVDEVFKTDETDNVNLDTFFISMADTPTVSGSSSTHRNLSNFNKKESAFNSRNNIVNSIAELENTIDLKEKQLVKSIINKGFDKKLIKKIDGDLNFSNSLSKGLSSAFCGDNNSANKERDTTKTDQCDLVTKLQQNQHTLNYMLKDGMILHELKQLGESNSFDLLDISVLKAFLNLPSLVQECSKRELYQEALFLQQVYLNNMHKFKSFLLRTQENDEQYESSVGIVILDSIKEFITKVIKDDMVNTLLDTLVSTNDFIILKRVVDVIIKVNHDDLRSLEMFIDSRHKYMSEYLEQSASNSTNAMDILDFFREELFNILNIYQLIFASNDSRRNLPTECFAKDFLLPCKIDYEEQQNEGEEQQNEGEEQKDEEYEQNNEQNQEQNSNEPNDKTNQMNVPKYTNILILKLLNDLFNELLTDKTFSFEKINTRKCILQLIYCAYRLKDSNINYFHLMLNKLEECNLFSKDEIIKSIEKRKELSMILTN